jgi:MFS family permease
MLTIFASDILQVGASGFGLLQSSRGLGAVLGSSVFIAMGHRPDQGKILFTSAILYGIGFALFGLSPSFLFSLALIAFVGVTDTIWGAARATILQLITPEKFRGRVMGVFQLSNRGLHPLGQTETGLVVPLIGAPAATFFGGLLVTVVTLITAWRAPEIPKFRWKEPGDHRAKRSLNDEERAAG